MSISFPEQITELLQREDRSLAVEEIAQKLGRDTSKGQLQGIRMALGRMVKKGLVNKGDDGRWQYNKGFFGDMAAVQMPPDAAKPFKSTDTGASKDVMADHAPESVFAEVEGPEDHTTIPYDPARPTLFTDGIPQKPGYARRWVACKRNGTPFTNRYSERWFQGWRPVSYKEVGMSWHNPAGPVDDTVEITNDSILMERPQWMRDHYKEYVAQKTEEQNEAIRRWAFLKNRSPEGIQLQQQGKGRKPPYFSDLKMKHVTASEDKNG